MSDKKWDRFKLKKNELITNNFLLNAFTRHFENPVNRIYDEFKHNPIDERKYNNNYDKFLMLYPELTREQADNIIMTGSWGDIPIGVLQSILMNERPKYKGGALKQHPPVIDYFGKQRSGVISGTDTYLDLFPSPQRPKSTTPKPTSPAPKPPTTRKSAFTRVPKQ